MKKQIVILVGFLIFTLYSHSMERSENQSPNSERKNELINLEQIDQSIDRLSELPDELNLNILLLALKDNDIIQLIKQFTAIGSINKKFRSLALDEKTCLKFINQAIKQLIKYKKKIAEHTFRRICKSGHEFFIDRFINNGIDINSNDEHNRNALQLASGSGKQKTVDLLLSKPASTLFDLLFAIIQASKYDQKQIVLHLLELDIISESDCIIDNELTRAILVKDIQKIEQLLENRDVNSEIAFCDITPLMLASCIGSLEIASLLIKEGADVNLGGQYIACPLFGAAKFGNIEIAKLLLAEKAEICITNKDGFTSLMIACESGYADIVELFLGNLDNNSPDIMHQSTTGLSGFDLASRNGNSKITGMFLEKNSSVAHQVTHDGYTPLMYACWHEHLDIIEQLINAGANVNAQTTNGLTPLLATCRNGTNAIQFLLTCTGIDVNVQDNYQQTPLMYAAKNGHTSIAELLLNNNDIDLTIRDVAGDNALTLATENGHYDIVKLILNKDTTIVDNATDLGDSPLMIACKKGYYDIAKILIDKGANVNAQDNEGVTPLMWACQKNGNVHIVEFLLNNTNLNINVQDNKQNTAIMMAAKGERSDMVKLLLNNRHIDLTITNSLGNNVLTLSCVYGLTQVVELLLQNNIGIINNVTKHHTTALTIACSCGFFEIVELLIANGATVNAQENAKTTPLMCASTNGYVNIVEFLLNNTDVNPAEKDEMQFTALDYARKNENTDIVNLLEKALN